MGKYDDAIGGIDIGFNINEVIDEDSHKKAVNKLEETRKKAEEPIKIKIDSGEMDKLLKQEKEIVKTIKQLSHIKVNTKGISGLLNGNMSKAEIQKSIDALQNLYEIQNKIRQESGNTKRVGSDFLSGFSANDIKTDLLPKLQGQLSELNKLGLDNIAQLRERERLNSRLAKLSKKDFERAKVKVVDGGDAEAEAKIIENIVANRKQVVEEMKTSGLFNKQEIKDIEQQNKGYLEQAKLLREIRVAKVKAGEKIVVQKEDAIPVEQPTKKPRGRKPKADVPAAETPQQVVSTSEISDDSSLSKLKRDADAASKAFEDAHNRLLEIMEAERKLDEQIKNAGLVDYAEKYKTAATAREEALSSLRGGVDKKSDHKANVGRVKDVVHQLRESGALGVAEDASLSMSIIDYESAVNDYTKNTKEKMDKLFAKVFEKIDKTTQQTLSRYLESGRKQANEVDVDGLLRKRQKLREEHEAASKSYNDTADLSAETRNKVNAAEKGVSPEVIAEQNRVIEEQNAKLVERNRLINEYIEANRRAKAIESKGYKSPEDMPEEDFKIWNDSHTTMQQMTMRPDYDDIKQGVRERIKSEFTEFANQFENLQNEFGDSQGWVVQYNNLLDQIQQGALTAAEAIAKLRAEMEVVETTQTITPPAITDNVQKEIDDNKKLESSYEGLAEAVEEFVKIRNEKRKHKGDDKFWELDSKETELRQKLVGYIPEGTTAHSETYQKLEYKLNRKENRTGEITSAEDILKIVESGISKAKAEQNKLAKETADIEIKSGEQSISAEQTQLDLTKEQLEVEKKITSEKEKQYGYHAGKFRDDGYKAENLFQSTPDRSTGFYGTGTYMTDEAHLREIISGQYGRRPLSVIDPDMYNLFDATNDKTAGQLHQFLQSVTNKSFGGKGENIKSLYAQFKELFPKEKVITYEEFKSLISELQQYVKTNRDKYPASKFMDSVSTKFMKNFGYEGVDTRGTKHADTTYGTVIYDLKEESIILKEITNEMQKQEIVAGNIAAVIKQQNNTPQTYETASGQMSMLPEAESHTKSTTKAPRKSKQKPAMEQNVGQMKLDVDGAEPKIEADVEVNPDEPAKAIEEAVKKGRKPAIKVDASDFVFDDPEKLAEQMSDFAKQRSKKDGYDMSKVSIRTDKNDNVKDAQIAYYNKKNNTTMIESYVRDAAAAEQGIERLVPGLKKITVGYSDFEKAILSATNRQNNFAINTEKTIGTMENVLDVNANRTLAGKDGESDVKNKIEAIKAEISKLKQDPNGTLDPLPEREFLAAKARIADLIQETRKLIQEKKNAVYGPTQLESHSVESGNKYRKDTLLAKKAKWEQQGIYGGELQAQTEKLLGNVDTIKDHDGLRTYLEGMKEARALADLATQSKKKEKGEMAALVKLQNERNTIAKQLAALDSLDSAQKAELIKRMRSAQEAYNQALAGATEEQKRELALIQEKHRETINLGKYAQMDAERRAAKEDARKKKEKEDKPYLNYGKTTANAAERKRDQLIGQYDTFDVVNPKIEMQMEAYKQKVQEVINLRNQFANDPNAAKDPALVKQFQKVSYEAEQARKGIKAILDEETRMAQTSEEQGFRATPLSPDQIANVEDEMRRLANSHKDGRVEIKGLNADHTQLYYTITNAKGTVQEMTIALGQGTNTLYQYRTATKETGTAVERFMKGISTKAKEISTFILGGGSIYRLIRIGREGIRVVRDIDLALTELKKVTDETEETYDKFLDTASKTAAKVGSTIKDVISSTADWARLNI